VGQIVILEGPDGSGKTTLARCLCNGYGFSYAHTGPPKPDENVLLDYALKLYRANESGKNTVIDRLHLGEGIYGPIMRGVDLLTEEGLVILQRMITAYDAKTVICLPKFDVASQNWRSKHNEYISDDSKYRRIYTAYAKLVPQYDHWDYKEVDVEDKADSLLTVPVPEDRCPPDVVGSPHPCFLVVGEKANQKELDVPWVDLNHGSHFLYECLHEAGFVEEELAFINALRIDNTETEVMKAWGALGSPTPILLGGIAKKLFFVAGFDNEPYSIPHPNYWMRFHSKRRAEYVEKLRRVRSLVYA
jgi:hypothetical protein